MTDDPALLNAVTVMIGGKKCILVMGTKSQHAAFVERLQNEQSEERLAPNITEPVQLVEPKWPAAKEQRTPKIVKLATANDFGISETPMRKKNRSGFRNKKK
jgi:hypothetical protein